MDEKKSLDTKQYLLTFVPALPCAQCGLEAIKGIAVDSRFTDSEHAGDYTLTPLCEFCGAVVYEAKEQGRF